MSACRVRLFDTGYCSHPEHVVLRTRRLRPMRFPAMFALIEHPERGPVLFDTGYGAAYLEARRHWTGRIYDTVTPVTTDPSAFAVARLRSIGLEPGDVGTVIASHFHADHVAGLRDFPRADFVYLRGAWLAVRGRSGISALRRGFLPSLVPADFETRGQPIEDERWRPLPDEFAPFARGVDLFGDGSLVVVALPGHATGQLGLFVRRVGQGPLFLVADACWTSRSFREEIVPSSVTRLLFADMSAYRATLGHVASFARARPDVEIVPSHCGEAHARLVAEPFANCPAPPLRRQHEA